jgi:transcriptional regulator with XRE-family HTH domain
MSVVDHELAGCLRTWRERLTPAEAGLPTGAGRRTPGLRREEVAGLAGVSVDYLSRLEQGRAQSPSPSVLASLARTLRLTDEERSHLFRIAGQAEPGPGTIDRHVTPSLQRLLDRLTDVPVMVVDAAGEVIASNPLMVALMGDLSGASRFERTVSWRHFMGTSSRVVHLDGELEAAEEWMVADLHDALARYPNDQFLLELIDALLEGSKLFAEIWERRPMKRMRARTKRFNHPELGTVTLDCDALGVHGSDLNVIVYTAPAGSPDAESLKLLSAIGLQTF